MFKSCSSFNQPLDNWDVSSATNMSGMFYLASSFNQPLSSWDVSSATNMQDMFRGTSAFNQPLNSWNTSNVTTMNSMFRGAGVFNSDINGWDLSSVTNFSNMFRDANSFNQPIGGWTLNTTGNITMASMFYQNVAFNNGGSTDINNWNTSNVTNMSNMFYKATAFNQPIGNWNTSNVTNVTNMLANLGGSTYVFDQDISNWDVNQITGFSNFMTGGGTGLSTVNYDALLIAWDAEGAMSYSGTVNFGGSTYTLGGAAETARTSLIAKWGGIIDGGGVTQPFIIQVKTDNAGTSASNQFTIPTNTSGITQAFNYDIETSDGQTITGVTGNHTITFPSAGTYEVRISGSFPYIYFNNGGDRSKMLDVSNFGIYALGSTSQANAFRGCSNMTITATDSGNFGSVTNFTNAWRGCGSLTSFPLLDTSSVTNFTNAWYGCNSLTSFPLLDTSSGTSFQSAWQSCSSLANYPANAFDTNIATNYTNAFRSTNLTTQSIDDILVSLDTSGVSNGTFFQSGGQAPSATGQTAIDNLVIKGWAITVTT
jgi:surface protein